MAERKAHIQRETTETNIDLRLDLDGCGAYEIETGCGFFDHMLSHIARHGLIDLRVAARGDLDVDAHHTVEDVAICLGKALEQALGDKRGITRFGMARTPMEDTLAEVVVDLSGRAHCVCNVAFGSGQVGQFDTDLVAEFLRALAGAARMNLHANLVYGHNDHHIAEAVFKSLGRALRQAVALDDRCAGVPSTKGSL